MTEETTIPTAKARVGVQLELGGFRIIVDSCPFCQGKHTHMSRETSGNLGKRTAPCGKGEYQLVIAESEEN